MITDKGKSVLPILQSFKDFILLCTNTLHKLVPDIAAAIDIPILQIAEVTADELIRNKIRKVGLLGTKPTMVLDFYKDKLMKQGIDTIIPSLEEIESVNDLNQKNLY